ncbi:hypothetical protein [Litoreibacter roseus]|uniref:Uncharacterized protein n=1 Tax=Litoreibacter roseus TaxID=2601869 RepID=A0A6N6JJ89_9RHOB|nr:hypothetical protein [Litoreibacter roseus]GFE65890.1 hypothetical protein KIN_29640 [Litoreibacter roseus]
MKKLMITSALAALIGASGVTAETLNPQQQATKDAIAADLNLNPEEYTLQELSRLSCELEGVGTEAERTAILQAFEGFDPVPKAADDAAKEQLAEELGVNADDYTVLQLAYMKNVVEDENCAVKNPSDLAKVGEEISHGGAAAKFYISTELGVEPTDYTLNELVQMRFDQLEDND